MADRSGPLGHYLRARRALVRPEQVGLYPGHSRHVPGLRREEVAMLAGLSTDYYAQLEQGRERRPSTQVVDALARVLLLDVDAHRHLRELAGPRGLPTGPRPTSDADLRMLSDLIQRWATTPAMVVTTWLEVVARNDLADALYDGLSYRDNLARMTFLSPEVEDFVDDWNGLARCTVATLRDAAGPEPHEPELVELVGELSRSSDPFRRLWARHDVHRKGNARKGFRHAVVGPLPLRQYVMTLPDHPELQVWTYQPEPGTLAEQALMRLSEMDTTAGRDGPRTVLR